MIVIFHNHLYLKKLYIWLICSMQIFYFGSPSIDFYVTSRDHIYQYEKQIYLNDTLYIFLILCTEKNTTHCI